MRRSKKRRKKMKILICSDIHGDAQSLASLLARYEEERADKILILGDVIYHGPRNDLPSGYAPKKVIAMLSELKEEIISVRGNCDTEVDQMVLPFPILSDYSYIFSDGLTILATHGHKYTPENPPPMAKGTIMLGGHTHVPKIVEIANECFYVNPGSISLPKENNPKTYAIYENRKITLKTLDGELFMEKEF